MTKDLDKAMDAIQRARQGLDDTLDRLYRERCRMYPRAVFTRQGPGIAEVRAYRDAHGCSLMEAVKSTGWTGTRAHLVTDGGPDGR